jgi:ubiquinone biosynthesis monooxygenase Coq7
MMFDLVDNVIIGFDDFLRKVLPTWPEHPSDDNPANFVEPGHLSYLEKHQVSAMMRVNLAGEVAAQGLYRGQMLLARNSELKQHLQQAAEEELSHFAWCYQRLQDLDARPSVFNPIWYCGALMIGLMASVIGDANSLGFVIATEEQVGKHLAGHLERLPPQDLQSRAIVVKMYEDELAHAQEAATRGGERLPLHVQQMMHWTAQVMIQASSLL